MREIMTKTQQNMKQDITLSEEQTETIAPTLMAKNDSNRNDSVKNDSNKNTNIKSPDSSVNHSTYNLIFDSSQIQYFKNISKVTSPQNFGGGPMIRIEGQKSRQSPKYTPQFFTSRLNPKKESKQDRYQKQLAIERFRYAKDNLDFKSLHKRHTFASNQKTMLDFMSIKQQQDLLQASLGDELKDLSVLTQKSVQKEDDQQSECITAREIVQKTLKLKPKKIMITENDDQHTKAQVLPPSQASDKKQTFVSKRYSEINRNKKLEPLRFRKASPELVRGTPSPRMSSKKASSKMNQDIGNIIVKEFMSTSNEFSKHLASPPSAKYKEDKK